MLPSDKDLMHAFQNGDEFAFVSLYNRHKSAVYGFCLKMLLNEEAARDVLHETFLRVYENRDRLINAASFKTWLFTIARNQSLNYLRRSSRTVPLPDESESGAMAAEVDTPFSRMEKNERVQLVNRFLRTLPPSYREVLILREYQNLNYEEIAAVTRSTISAVKSRLFKARRKLGSLLVPFLDTDNDSNSDEARTKLAPASAS